MKLFILTLLVSLSAYSNSIKENCKVSYFAEKSFELRWGEYGDLEKNELIIGKMRFDYNMSENEISGDLYTDKSNLESYIEKYGNSWSKKDIRRRRKVIKKMDGFFTKKIFWNDHNWESKLNTGYTKEKIASCKFANISDIEPNTGKAFEYYSVIRKITETKDQVIIDMENYNFGKVHLIYKN